MVSITLQSVFLTGFLFLIPILVWSYLKPLIENEKQINLYKRNFQKIKNNPTVFEGLLSKSQKIGTEVEGLGILLKNEASKYHVIKVCNPYCGPCASAHPILDELYHQGVIDLQILFTASAEENDKRFQPVNHLLAIDSLDATKSQKALDDWYMADKKDYAVFASKYPMNGELQQQKNKIEQMYKWCEAEKITHTPTVFVNGYKLADEYTIADLKEILQ
jgi:thiol-disulfide isomerase/thioredoxin